VVQRGMGVGTRIEGCVRAFGVGGVGRMYWYKKR
jgi:hypothetical protein